MNSEILEIKNNIIDAALPNVAFDGWTDQLILDAIDKAGYDSDIFDAVFINGLSDAVEHFSFMVDEEMMEKLNMLNVEEFSIRRRVYQAVEERLIILNRNKEAVKMGLIYWGIPLRGINGGKCLWRSSDLIWDWAGDRSTDYNKYSKRLILSGVIASTILYWLQDDSDNIENTLAFLDRKIQNVVGIGKFIGGLKSKIL